MIVLEDNSSDSKKTICILGAGHQGLTMAAHLALNGETVNIWNRTEQHIKKVIQSHEIICDGIIEGIGHIKKASSNISEVISNMIMVTVPSNAYDDIAKELAPHISKDMVIILNPGRTFGALQFANALRKYSAKAMPYIAETQTIVYTCRKKGTDSVTIFALKNNVMISSVFPEKLPHILNHIPECIRPCFIMEKQYLKTTMSNVGMVLHCAPVLMNVGWIENKEANFKYYYNGISKSIAIFLEKIDEERIKVAKNLGCSIISTKDWIEQIYHVKGNSLYDSIRQVPVYKKIDAPPTLNTRYILEDVPNGLVPIEHLGKQLAIHTPAITTIINLASMIYNTDFISIGRKFGVDDIEEHRAFGYGST